MRSRWLHLVWGIPLVGSIVLAFALRARESGGEAPPSVARPAEIVDGSSSEELLAPSLPEHVPTLAERSGNAQAPLAGSGEPFRGEVLDVATGEAIGLLEIRAGEAGIAVDAAGRFEGKAADVTELLFRDPFLDKDVCVLAREQLERGPAGDWIARIPIGPTYRLRAVGEDPGLVGWSARLIEVSKDLDESAMGEWVELQGDPPFLRYPKPWSRSWAEGHFRVELRTPQGTSFGMSTRLDSAVGIFPGIVSVEPLLQLATIVGRAVDERGEPVRLSDVRAIPRGAIAALDVAGGSTRWERFEIRSLEPGPYRLYLRGDEVHRPATLSVVARPGTNEMPDVLLEGIEVAGSLRGRLVSSSGLELASTEMVFARGLDGQADRLEGTRPGGVQSHGPEGAVVYGDPNEQVFVVERLPAGRFEIGVLPREGFVWEPPAIVVEVPADDIIFRRRDDLSPVDLWFSAVDAASGSAIEPFDLELRHGLHAEPWKLEVERGGQLLASLPSSVPFTWVVQAKGYRPARGTDADLRRTERGLEGQVVLERGFGLRVLVLQDEFERGWIRRTGVLGKPLAGAKVLAEGSEVAVSDENGVADLVLDRKPAALEVRAPGWRMTYPPVLPEDLPRWARSSELVVWMIEP